MSENEDKDYKSSNSFLGNIISTLILISIIYFVITEPYRLGYLLGMAFESAVAFSEGLLAAIK